MTARILLLVLITLTLSPFLWAQGECRPGGNTWSISGGLGNGSQPNYSQWADYIATNQAMYGGIGPSCNAVWVPYVSPPAWTGVCASVTTICTSDPPIGGCAECSTDAGEPIDLGEGNVFIRQTDVRLPGLGGGLTLTRTWNSSPGSSAGGMFGPGWISNYEERVSPGGDGTMKYERSDGSVWTFGFYGNQPNYALISPPNGQATLTEMTQNQQPIGWMVTFQNGEQRVFNLNPPFITATGAVSNNVGWLNTIMDRNGNSITLNYQTVFQGGVTIETNLLSVTDAVGRHLYFTYNSSNQVASVTSDPGTGINVTYSYSLSQAGYPVLTVTQTDNTFMTYNYDAFNHIVSVTDTNGKVLESHIYDFLGRGLTSSRANGVEALTVTYP